MEPMKPMQPMKPMEPMKPMSETKPWWPDDLGRPSSSGSQNGMRYAVFPDRQRLLVDTDGTVATYDTGDHRIGGVQQSDGGTKSVTFSSQDGPVALDTLRKLD